MSEILYWLKEHLKDVIFIFLIFVSLGCSGYLLFLHEENNNDQEFKLTQVNDQEDKQTIKEKFYVEIKGAVKKPGVYEVEEGNIIQDVINLADGLSTNAYTGNINLSKLVAKEMLIYVYTKTEFKTKTNTTNNKNNSNLSNAQEVCETSSYVITECTQDGNSTILSNGNSTSKGEDAKKEIININTASVQELTTLSGIGSSKAQAIIDYRTEKGKFEAIEDIKKVTGIGDSIFEKIKNYITV